MTERYAHLAPNAYEGDLGRLGNVTTTAGKVLTVGNTVGDILGNTTSGDAAR